MSVNIRRHPRGGWDVDINVLLATGDRHRERRKMSASYSKTTAREWGERRERELLLTGPKVRKEVPTLEAFAPRFIEGYARANRQKPSGVAAKESILRLYLIPELGTRTLDTISNEQVQRLKLRLHDKSPKTINNVLSVLNVLLKQAVEWGVLDKMPCSIRLVRVPRTDAAFHDFDDYERLLRPRRRSTRGATSSPSSEAKRDCGRARSSHSNGPTSISSDGRFGCGTPIGAAN